MSERALAAVRAAQAEARERSRQAGVTHYEAVAAVVTGETLIVLLEYGEELMIDLEGGWAEALGSTPVTTGEAE